MNIQFPVDQVASFRNGFESGPVVTLDIDLANLSDAERNYLAEHLEGKLYTGDFIEAPLEEAAIHSIHCGASNELERDFSSSVSRRCALKAVANRQVTMIHHTIFAHRHANGAYEFSPFCRLVDIPEGVIQGEVKYTSLAADRSVSFLGPEADLPEVKMYFDWIEQENKRRKAKAERAARADLEQKEIALLKLQASARKCS